MSFTKRVLYGIEGINNLISESITGVKDWCNNRFALKSNIPTSIDPKIGIVSGVHERTGLGVRNKNNALNLGNEDSAKTITIGNLIIQCGNFDTFGNKGIERFTSNISHDISFPTEFPNKCLVVVATTTELNEARTHGNGPQVIATIQGWDNTKFRVIGDHVTTNYDIPCGVSWIAIGY